MTINTLRIIQPDDWHLHLRQGNMLHIALPHTARQFGRAIVMPNTRAPVTTTAQALAYRAEILTALTRTMGEDAKFAPLMTLYLTDNTAPDEIRRAHASGHVHGVKLYPAGATTNSDAGVTDLLGRCHAVLETMQDVGLPLLVHGEVTDPTVDMFDREAVFIDRIMQPLRHAFPALKVVFEHLTTQEGVDYVFADPGPTAATITPQHLLYNRNALFSSGIRPHWYCMPILKRETHRLRLLQAATSGNPRFFLGTDSAPHVQHLKEHGCGCAGCYTALHAMALYASAFDAVGQLDKLQGFASVHGPAFYGLPVNQGTLVLQREVYDIPASVPVGAASLIPLAAGETLPWRVVHAT